MPAYKFTFPEWDSVIRQLVEAHDSLPLRSRRRMAIERAIVALRNVWDLHTQGGHG